MILKSKIFHLLLILQYRDVIKGTSANECTPLTLPLCTESTSTVPLIETTSSPREYQTFSKINDTRHFDSEQLVQLSTPVDLVLGLCYTSIGRDTVLSSTVIGHDSCQSPSIQELVNSVLDNSLETKYLNFGNANAETIMTLKGVGTGFGFMPSRGTLSILRAFQCGTANDFPERDPMTISIEGTASMDQSELQRGSSWTLIYIGWTGINRGSNAPRNTYGSLIYLNNTVPYRVYRLLVASQRAAANSVQYSEVKLYGYFL